MQNWTSRWLLTLLIISTCYAGTTLRVQAARPTELYFSEYLEGSSNNKALELFNGTGAPINLAGNGYNIQIFFNGATTASLTLNLTGTVANDDVYVVAHSSALLRALRRHSRVKSGSCAWHHTPSQVSSRPNASGTQSSCS